jgi:hypothetical protein
VYKLLILVCGLSFLMRGLPFLVRGLPFLMRPSSFGVHHTPVRGAQAPDQSIMVVVFHITVCVTQVRLVVTRAPLASLCCAGG